MSLNEMTVEFGNVASKKPFELLVAVRRGNDGYANFESRKKGENNVTYALSINVGSVLLHG